MVLDKQWFENFAYKSSFTMIVVGIVTCLSLIYGPTAPYGKFTQAKGWGVLIPAKVGWFIMESPTLWTTFLVYMYGQRHRLLQSSKVNNILLSLFILHYINRSLIFPHFLSNGNPMPISIAMFAFIYCTWNGLTQSTSLLISEQYDDSYLYRPNFIVGVCLYFLGMMINIQSDFNLLNMRKKLLVSNKKAVQEETKKNLSKEVIVEKIHDLPITKRYAIPRGGLFDHVSAANYSKIYLSFLFFPT
jgi:3-oxo-5-alpha-steroid 4-dehydrogenase 1